MSMINILFQGGSNKNTLGRCIAQYIACYIIIIIQSMDGRFLWVLILRIKFDKKRYSRQSDAAFITVIILY